MENNNNTFILAYKQIDDKYTTRHITDGIIPDGWDSESFDTIEAMEGKIFKLHPDPAVAESRQYLASTDWIYAKCAELELKASEEYPEIVEKRKEARMLIL